MTVADKLQVKSGQRITLLRAPDDVDLGIPDAGDDVEAVLLFVTHRAELEEHSAPLVEAGRRDALAWVAYPKAGQLGDRPQPRRPREPPQGARAPARPADLDRRRLVGPPAPPRLTTTSRPSGRLAVR
jgi:hypothetical protein